MAWPGTIVSVRVAVTVRLANPLSDAVNNTDHTPFEVGVPVIRPLVALTVSPGGSGAALNWLATSGPVVIRYEKATPFVPVAVVGLVMTVEAPETACTAPTITNAPATQRITIATLPDAGNTWVAIILHKGIACRDKAKTSEKIREVFITEVQLLITTTTGLT
jgi:hypothetical protein